MKKKIRVCLVLLLMFVCTMSFVCYGSDKHDNSKEQSIEVITQNCNIKFENGEKDTFEYNFYGSANASNYELTTKSENNIQKISLNYIGSITAPLFDEGGVIIKIPNKNFDILDITGRNAGISVECISIDTNMITRGCSVQMKNENDIYTSIDSTYDNYEIDYAPITKKFFLKEKRSNINFKLNSLPTDLHFTITEEGNTTTDLPLNWDKDYIIGAGSWEVSIENNGGIFRLTY